MRKEERDAILDRIDTTILDHALNHSTVSVTLAAIKPDSDLLCFLDVRKYVRCELQAWEAHFEEYKRFGRI